MRTCGLCPQVLSRKMRNPNTVHRSNDGDMFREELHQLVRKHIDNGSTDTDVIVDALLLQAEYALSRQTTESNKTTNDNKN